MCNLQGHSVNQASYEARRHAGHELVASVCADMVTHTLSVTLDPLPDPDSFVR